MSAWGFNMHPDAFLPPGWGCMCHGEARMVLGTVAACLVLPLRRASSTLGDGPWGREKLWEPRTQPHCVPVFCIVLARGADGEASLMPFWRAG